jgi:hypothetical protein
MPAVTSRGYDVLNYALFDCSKNGTLFIPHVNLDRVPERWEWRLRFTLRDDFEHAPLLQAG